MAKQSGNKTAKGTVNPATAGEPMVQIANRVPASVHRALKLACVAGNVSMGEAIEAAIGMWLASQGKGKVSK